ncbi:MAG: DUF4097 family beta strand repeat protein [Deltaproteobacteria bacterium]|nr:DUF4097 family beta strand repeat protein [Deltaproteobacteria bacterium]
MSRNDCDDDCIDPPKRGGGISGFIRSLLSGVPWSERAEVTETLNLETPPLMRMRVDNANGRTQVIGEDRNDIEVEIHKTARAESEEGAQRLVEEIQLLTREDAQGVLELEVDIPGRWNRQGRADLTIRLPKEIWVAVQAANGRICLDGLRGKVRAHSSNGPVRATNVIGDMDLQAMNAKVQTICTCGRLLARSSNGKIQVEEHRGGVDASTTNGTVTCKIDELGKEGIILVTSNGRISLDLPEDADGDLDVRVDNGLIRTSRELSGESPERRGRLKVTLGQGGIPIRLRASNGTITVR